MKYYRIVDDQGIPLRTGYNATSKKELAQGYIDLIYPQIEQDYQILLKNMTLKQRLQYIEVNGYYIEESETPFEEK